jgi:adenylate kinase
MSVRARPWPALLLVGPTGAGKTPLGEELARRGLGSRRCVHFDFGTNLRALAANRTASAWLSDAERATIEASLTTGALFEDRDMPMIVRIVERFAAGSALGPDAVLVLNGLPRHASQAQALAGLLAVGIVVRLDAPPGVIRERMRIDPAGDRSGRSDDSPAAIERRLLDYRARTLPLVDHYRGLGVPVLDIAVTEAMTAADMFEALIRLGAAREFD